jgi:hypothetical protein
MITFDAAMRTFDSAGVPLGGRYKTRDGKTVDSTGAFLVGELERLDQTLNMPQISIKYTRDIDIREDVTIADEFSSYTQNAIAAAGSLGATGGLAGGKSWIGKTTTQLSSVSVDIDKIATPLTIWGKELKYTIPELESAAKLGRPIDQQKFEALDLAHQMDCDAQAYVGDSDLGQYGLLNSPKCIATNLPNGIAGGSAWMPSAGYAGKTPDEILADINQMITTGYKNSGFAIKPNRIGIDPLNYGYISTAKVATAAGTMSIRRYIEENNLLAADGAGKLTIVDMKWLIGCGVGGTLGTVGTVNRAICYTKDYKFVRFPKTQIQRTPIQYEGLYHKTTYYCRIGAVEQVYPENCSYYDGN